MIKKLLENIKNELLQIPEVQTTWIYPSPRTDIIAPAIFIEIGNLTQGSDPATSELSLIANIEARVVVDSTIEQPDIIGQTIACNVAHKAHLNSFGCDVTPGRVNSITKDAWKPEFDAFNTWLVEWSHEFRIGESVWLETGVSPHIIHINGGTNE